jgi:hypothetical protein
MMQIVPIFQSRAFKFIYDHHRHHGRPVGSIFQIAVETSPHDIVGVCVVGRPVAREIDWRVTCEVTRLCTDGTPNACSKLYSAAARIAREMGYKKIITYILESESGISLKGSGWVLAGKTSGGTWNTPARSRTDKHPTIPKLRYEKNL